MAKKITDNKIFILFCTFYLCRISYIKKYFSHAAFTSFSNIAFVLTRECTKTNTINGIEFDEGDAIAIPIYSIQRDNEIWEDPYTFNPERFDG